MLFFVTKWIQIFLRLLVFHYSAFVAFTLYVFLRLKMIIIVTFFSRLIAVFFWGRNITTNSDEKFEKQEVSQFRPVVLNRGAVWYYQGCCQLSLLLICRSILAPRGASKYWNIWPRVPRSRKGWEALFQRNLVFTSQHHLLFPPLLLW